MARDEGKGGATSISHDPPGASGSGQAGLPSVGEPAATLSSIEIVPGDSTISIDGQLSLAVFGIHSNQTREDLTSQARVSSSDPAIAQVTSHTVTGVAAGTAEIKASVFGLSTTITLVVEAKSAIAITVMLDEPTIDFGDGTLVVGTQARAQGLMEDGTMQDVTFQAVWTSSNAKVARLTNTAFLLSMGQGSATISATLGKASGSAQCKISGDTLTDYSIASTGLMRAGDTRKLELHAHYASNRVTIERDARFESSDPLVLAVSDSGTVTALSGGKVTLRAWLGNTLAAPAEIQVTGAALQGLELVPDAFTYEFCEPPTLRVFGIFSDGSRLDVTHLALKWGAANSISIDMVDGELRVTPWFLGKTRVSVSLDNIEGSADLTATLGSPARIAILDLVDLPISESERVDAVAYCPNDSGALGVTELVTWSSSMPTMAPLEARAEGLYAVGLAVGTLQIRATYPNYIIAPAALTVFDAAPVALELSAENPHFFLDNGEDLWVTAEAVYGEDHDSVRSDVSNRCVWSSTNPEVVAVSNAPGTVGKLSLLGVGSSVITAKFGSVSAATKVTVSAN